MQASEFAGAVDGGLIPLDAALTWHLTSNHHPPLPVVLVPIARRAIRAARAGKNVNHRCPRGVYFRGGPTITTDEAIEAMHLEAFV